MITLRAHVLIGVNCVLQPSETVITSTFWLTLWELSLIHNKTTLNMSFRLILWA